MLYLYFHVYCIVLYCVALYIAVYCTVFYCIVAYSTPFDRNLNTDTQRRLLSVEDVKWFSRGVPVATSTLLFYQEGLLYPCAWEIRRVSALHNCPSMTPGQLMCAPIHLQAGVEQGKISNILTSRALTLLRVVLATMPSLRHAGREFGQQSRLQRPRLPVWGIATKHSECLKNWRNVFLQR